VSSSSKVPILVVEDEEPIRTGLCDVLAFNGYAPHGVERGDDALEQALTGRHALVLLDIMLPGLSGFDVCEQLRAANVETPVLMLTARGAEDDVIRGFRCGADDYVIKPFSVAELTARVEALLRRSGATADREAPTEKEAFRFGEWTVDPRTLSATKASGTSDTSDAAAPAASEPAVLTRRDVEILALFVRERGRIVGRRLLLGEIWGFPDPARVETRSVDMHIAKLRKKLRDDGSLIETIRGEGYRHR
jgi:DNA-binding response OmpR family regulator